MCAAGEVMCVLVGLLHAAPLLYEQIFLLKKRAVTQQYCLTRTIIIVTSAVNQG